MTKIPPTTTYQIDQPDTSPCCDAPLDLVSPPIGYECRECMQTYHKPANVDGTTDTCDTVMSSGDVCGRELPCQYHSEG